MNKKLLFARQRLSSLKSLLARLQRSQFPYDDSKQALSKLEQVVETQISGLDKIILIEDADESIVDSICKSSIILLDQYLPYAGILLRSTNVRNAFEIYGPMLRIAKHALGENTRLILSSEWGYSPFNKPPPNSLADYVILGSPSSESSNPLIIPIAGHELGHTVWAQIIDQPKWAKRVNECLDALIDQNLAELKERFGEEVSSQQLKNELNFVPYFDEIRARAARQIQELFCDLVGYRIFGDSYAHAFTYLLSPGTSRPPFYPSYQLRLHALEKSSNRFGYPSFPNIRLTFVQDMVGPDPNYRWADAIAEELVDELIEEVDSVLDRPGIKRSEEARIADIANSYRRFDVPYTEPELLSNILNAAWICFFEISETDDYDRRFELLCEIVMKNIEILEIGQRLGGLDDNSK